MSRSPQHDRDRGIFAGKSIARVLESPDGMIVLVGKSARDNDQLSLKLARPFDFWLHIASGPGSHVVVLNDQRDSRLPRATEQMAAALAARYSSAKKGGQVAVHLARAQDVSKPKGAAPGKVSIKRHRTVYGRPDDVRDLG